MIGLGSDKNIIRDGSSTALYTIYTVYTVYTVLTDLHCLHRSMYAYIIRGGQNAIGMG